ncbi:MAG TPA: ATP-binding protein [Anaeromyxobacter sp.]|nr:ATP-binding protein [Anaeromyxobacter sp.]
MSAERRRRSTRGGVQAASEGGTGADRTERGVAERFAALHSAAAALSAALTSSEVIAAIAARGAALPGACGCAVGVLASTGRLDVVCRRGTTGRPCEGSAAIPQWTGAPLAAAARERRVLLFEHACALGPDSAPCGEAPGALAALPLEAGGAVLGAVGVELAAPSALDEEEQAFLLAFAHEAAQALERARLFEAERSARMEAQRAAEAARRAVELSGQLVGIVGHDLRTPLAAIRMSAAVLLRRGGLTDEQGRTLARIDGAAARMTGIIHDLLDFTRMRNEGRIPVHLRPADLVPVVRRAIAELVAVHPSREIRLASPDAVRVDADPDRLAQVVTNLVGNAIQHSPPDARVTVDVEEDARAVAIGVHNEGPPIGAELLGEIFEPFHRGGRGGDGGSLGLGLFIVREVVRAHGGEVTVRSSAGEGTTFTVRLPAAPPAERGVPAPDR